MAGVEAASASEALSAEEGRASGGSAAEEAGDERSLGVFFSVGGGIAGLGLRSAGSFEKRLSSLGDSLRVRTREVGATTALEVEARERPFGVPAGMVWRCFGDGGLMMRWDERD